MMDADLLLLRDRLDIIELLARYHHAVDAKDWDALGRLFTPDAVAEYHMLNDVVIPGIEGRYAGAATIVDWIRIAQEPFQFNGAPTHFMTNHVVDIDGDMASSRSYFHDIDLVSGLVIGSGIYSCTHRRAAEQGWRVASMRLEQRLCDDVVARIADQIADSRQAGGR